MEFYSAIIIHLPFVFFVVWLHYVKSIWLTDMDIVIVCCMNNWDIDPETNWPPFVR